jgi:5'-3' exonuclease
MTESLTYGKKISLVLHENKPIIIIDISILFYTIYYETMTLYLLANGDPNLAISKMQKQIRSIEEPTLNTFKIIASEISRKNEVLNPNLIFKEQKFYDIFQKNIEIKIRDICKNVTNNKYIYGNVILIKDCRRSTNWRVQRYPTYKASRPTHNLITTALQFNGEMVGRFWQEIYPTIKHHLGLKVVYMDTLEADDLAYFIKKNIREVWPTTEIKIITRDHDYLQLEDTYTKILNFQGINLNQNQSPQLNLALKILTGDTSDNIPPIFRKCGKVTAQKILNILFHQNDGNEYTPQQLIHSAAVNFLTRIKNDDFDKISQDIYDYLTPPRRSSRTGPSQNVYSKETIQNNLKNNADLIDMRRIPKQYYTRFIQQYKIIKYTDAVEQIAPTKSVTYRPTQAHSLNVTKVKLRDPMHKSY